MTSSSNAEAASAQRVHLRAAAAAMLSLAVVLGIGSWYALRYERAHLSALTPLLGIGREANEEHVLGSIEHLKNQGIVLQKRAFERADLLPLYGSSELLKRIPEKASVFFREYPTGFAVFPVGKAGATSLVMAEKLAALGDQLRGKRVAISLSPSWFLTANVPERPYEGNFSHEEALAALENRRLSGPVKRLLAQRMLAHPATLEEDRLLHFLALHLARDSWGDRLLCRLTRPLAELQKAMNVAQDHVQCLALFRLYEHHLRRSISRVPVSLNWDRLIADASNAPLPTTAAAARAALQVPEAGSEHVFRQMLDAAEEWRDLDLLVHALAEIGAKPLILCMPPNGSYYEKAGVSRETLLRFSAQIREVAARYGAAVDTFEDHDEDTSFLADHHDHMSSKGWMYYNRALDEFYHAASPSLVAHNRRHRTRHPSAD